MTDPTVCCVMLTRDRPEFARKALECFRSQTYQNKHLLIWDTGDEFPADIELGKDVWYGRRNPPDRCISIGKLRNDANSDSPDATDIIIHWDDDDWSHPERIAEQVALLQSSGADCVGYRECLFWRTDNQAWLYSNGDKRMAIGSSLCYWRKTWLDHPFSEMSGPNLRIRGEDQIFRNLINCLGVYSLGNCVCYEPPKQHEPRMICRIHAGNAAQYPVDEWAISSPHWKRVPRWDEQCRLVMA